MRTYLILKYKAANWPADKEIRAILQEVSSSPAGTPSVDRYSAQVNAGLLARVFDKDAIQNKRLPYERLDQLTIDILTGTR